MKIKKEKIKKVFYKKKKKLNLKIIKIIQI